MTFDDRCSFVQADDTKYLLNGGAFSRVSARISLAWSVAMAEQVCLLRPFGRGRVDAEGVVGVADSVLDERIIYADEVYWFLLGLVEVKVRDVCSTCSIAMRGRWSGCEAP